MGGKKSILSGSCFIATAAYGTPMAEEMGILREFRDVYLLTNPVGQALADLYYRVSRAMAQFIVEHPSLKPIVRVGLLPAVAMSAIAVNTTQADRMAIVGLLTLTSLALVAWTTRRQAEVQSMPDGEEVVRVYDYVFIIQLELISHPFHFTSI